LTVIRILAILSLDADWSNTWLYFGETVDKTWAIELLRSAGALLEGHFLLSSGNHSNAYIQCALLLARPEIAHDFMEDMAEHYREQKIDTVAAPAVGGIIVAYEIAKILGKRAIFLERENGVMSLRRGFSISRGERILIVEDVITTGGSVIEVGEVRLLTGRVEDSILQNLTITVLKWKYQFIILYTVLSVVKNYLL
jgi:orotate phosphoribosyltransferase